VNLYRYVGNGPAKHIDPSGLIPPNWEPPFDWTPFPLPPLDSLPTSLAPTPGIYICERDLQGVGAAAGGSPAQCGEQTSTCVLNLCFADHAFLVWGTLDAKGNPTKGTVGIGLSGGGKGKPPTPEKSFKPSSCRKLKRTNVVLTYGDEAGKQGKNASDAEIWDCLTKFLTSKPYKPFGPGRYNCIDWSNEAAIGCGLDGVKTNPQPTKPPLGLPGKPLPWEPKF